MYYDLVSNIIDVLFLCGVVIWINLSLNQKYSHYILGVMFGLITIFVMKGHIMVAEGRFFDFRHITMTMAGFIGGPVTAVIAALISSLYRYHIAGTGSMGGIANIIVFACFGSILGKYLRSDQNGKRLLFWLTIGVIMTCLLLLIIAVISPWITGTVPILGTVFDLSLIITPLSVTLIFNFYFWANDFLGKASILNTIINSSPINLIIFNAQGPILFSKNIKTELRVYPFITSLFPLVYFDNTCPNTIGQLHKEIATEDGRHFVADMSSFQMPNGKNTCLAILNDITEQKLSREKLIEAQRETVSILESMTDCFFAIDGDWQFTYLNRAGEILFGKYREELLGRKMTEVFNFQDDVLLHFQVAFCEKRPVTFEIVSELLGNKYLEMNAYPTENGLTCYFRDITGRKLAENEIARLDRLNLVGQLAAGIGHEIRNPMTTVRGYLQLLGEKPDFAARKSTFELMISEIDRANSIITEFLSLAQTKQTELKSQNLNDILNHLYPLIEADVFTQNKQISFIPQEIPLIKLNAKEISQLILNLTRNGLDAMQERGCLTIKSYLQDDKVILAIADEGCGIPSENISKIGTPFFTTKDDGTGLGLATCYKIAESHNAKVNIESSPSGTTFFIIFSPDKEQGKNGMVA
ncbi:MAG: ATP-binding protein [Desulfosporosinus sp.]|nr:ATP-binding protein [Desulfosporosinus sp.]